jgi:hydrogenase maturation factor
MALVEVRGTPRWFNALTEPGLKAGDFVLTHTGLIIAILSQEEASQIDRDLREMEQSQFEFEEQNLLIESDL